MPIVRPLAAPLLALAAAPRRARARPRRRGVDRSRHREDPPVGRRAGRRDRASSAARNEFEAFQIAIAGPGRQRARERERPDGPGRHDRRRAALPRGAHRARQRLGPRRRDRALAGRPRPRRGRARGRAAERVPLPGPRRRERARSGSRCSCPPTRPRASTRARVAVTWDGGAATVPVTLTVWPFTLPSTRVAPERLRLHLRRDPVRARRRLGRRASRRCAPGTARFALDHRISLSHVDDGYSALDHFASLYGPAARRRRARRGSAGARMTVGRAHGLRLDLVELLPPARLVRAALPVHLRRAPAHLRLERHPRPRGAPRRPPTPSCAPSSPPRSRRRTRTA